jgi:hypothetical protein
MEAVATASPPSTRQIPRGDSLVHDSDEDGQEPDTEESDSEGGEGDQDVDVAAAGSQESNIADLMNRSRLVTRSPTLEVEPELWAGIFSPYTAYFDTEDNAKMNKLSKSSKSSAAQREANKS